MTLILCILIGLPHNGAANTTDENRRVSETLNENESVDEAGKDQEPTVTEDVTVGETEQPADEIIPEQNTFFLFAQMISALALVIVLIYLLLRFVNKRSQSFRSSQMLQNIGGVPLGANKSVQLVKVGNRVLVVGVGESIQLLKEIEDKEEMNQILIQQQEQFEQLEQPFMKLFNANKWGSKNVKTEKVETNSDAFKHLLSKQLKDVSKAQKKIHDAVRESDK
jgi:flagellar protein FliO/FliZ